MHDDRTQAIAAVRSADQSMPAASTGHESGVVRAAGQSYVREIASGAERGVRGTSDNRGGMSRVFLVGDRLVSVPGVVSAIESAAGRAASVGAEIRDEDGGVVAHRTNDGWVLV